MANDSKKRALGRGLAALLANTSGEDPALPAAEETHPGERAAAPGAQEIALDLLSPNPHQPRKEFDAQSLQELADSIRVHGIIQPLVVTQAGDDPQRFWIVAGERRWRAARLAGLAAAPAIVRAASSQALTELALVENIQRADLNALEEAQAYAALMEEHGLTQAEVAERVGKSRPAVANALRLLGLPAETQAALVEGRITAGHARALLSLPDAAAMLLALDEIERRGLSVREAEALVKQWNELRVQEPPAPKAQPDPRVAAHIVHLENRFRSALGTKVQLNRNDDGSGRLVVHFFNDGDLEHLYRLIAGEGGDGEDGNTLGYDL
jgi:ParB family chromosome partitioning protein